MAGSKKERNGVPTGAGRPRRAADRTEPQVTVTLRRTAEGAGRANGRELLDITRADRPRRPVELFAHLVKDWGTTLRAAFLLAVLTLCGGSVRTPGALRDVVGKISSVSASVNLSAEWLPWSIVLVLAAAEGRRRVTRWQEQRRPGPGVPPAEDGTPSATPGKKKKN